MIDTLTKPDDFREVVQDSEPACISDLGNQAKNGICADIEKRAASWAHETATDPVPDAMRPLSRAQAVKSASARRDIISFFALPRSRRASGGIKPKFTFIG